MRWSRYGHDCAEKVQWKSDVKEAHWIVEREKRRISGTPWIWCPFWFVHALPSAHCVGGGLML